MTNKEKLCDWICQMPETEGFETIDQRQGTYFIDYNEQSALIEYEIDNKRDIEHYMNLFFDDELSEFKTECVKQLLNSMYIYSASASEERKKKKHTTGIREYIYNF